MIKSELVKRFKECSHPESHLVDGPREEMRHGTGPTQYCSACGASRNMLHEPGPWRAPNFDDLAALNKSKPELMAEIKLILSPPTPDDTGKVLLTKEQERLVKALEAQLHQQFNIEVLGEWSALDINHSLQKSARAKIDATNLEALAAIAASKSTTPAQVLLTKEQWEEAQRDKARLDWQLRPMQTFGESDEPWDAWILYRTGDIKSPVAVIQDYEMKTLVSIYNEHEARKKKRRKPDTKGTSV